MTKHILIIEDNDLFRDYLKKILSEEEYYVNTAENGIEAIDKINNTIPDLIITDILMPDMDGLEVIEKIKDQNQDVKIIAISGGDWLEPDMYLNLASKLDVDSVLKKPFKKEILLNTVSSVLDEV